MFSKSILSTNTDKTTLNWFEYWIGHCIMTGFQSINISFDIWKDWISGNYEGYGLLKDDDPYEECKNWFWDTLGADETYPKSFLEDLLRMSKEVETGEIETYSLDELMESLKDLVGDMIDLDEEQSNGSI